MPESTISYELLYEALRKEKYEPELQKLNDSFFQEVINYLKEKSSILESQKKKDTVFTSKEVIKTETQIENIKRLLHDLYEKRENKIIQLSLSNSRNLIDKHDTINMLPEEKEFYFEINKILNNYRNDILTSLIDQRLPLLKKEEPKELKTNSFNNTKLVRFLHPVPKFIGTDLSVYGPFEKEDIASLPEKIANLLIERKRVQEVEFKT